MARQQVSDTIQVDYPQRAVDILNSLIPKQEQVYRDLYGKISQICLIVDSSGIVLDINSQATVMTGYSRSDIVGAEITEFLNPNSKNRFEDWLLSLPEVGPGESEEYEFFFKNKGFHSVRITAVRGFSNFHKSEVIYLFFSLSCRKKLGEILDPEIKVWMKICDIFEEIITAHDKDLRIVAANKAAQEFFASDYGEVVGRYCYEIFNGVNKPCDSCPLTKNPILKQPDCIVTNQNTGDIFRIRSHLLTTEKTGVTYQLHIAENCTPHCTCYQRLPANTELEKGDDNNFQSSISKYSESEPVSDAPNQRITPVQPPDSVTMSSNHETILLVEEDFFLLEMTARLLRALNYQVLPAMSYAGAYDIVKEYSGVIQLLLVNTAISRVDATEFVEQTCALHPDCKIIYTAQYPFGPEVTDLVSAGKNILQKPFSTSELAGMVYSSLNPSNTI